MAFQEEEPSLPFTSRKKKKKNVISGFTLRCPHDESYGDQYDFAGYFFPLSDFGFDFFPI